jgi:hypothetical protein
MKNAEIYVGIGVAAAALAVGALFYNKNSKVDPIEKYDAFKPDGEYVGGGSNKKTRNNKKKNNKSAKNKN